MEDRAYQNAVGRRKALMAELEEIDQFLALWKRYAGTEPERSNVKIGPLSVSGGDIQPGARSMSREEMAPKLREIVLRVGHPMTRGQLVNEATLNGLKIGGTNKNKNMGTIMWRLRDRFVNIENEGYWPKDVPCEAVGYAPTVEVSGTAPDDEPDLLS